MPDDDSDPAVTGPHRPHNYLSTWCYHGRHDGCRVMCKFCAETCRCACHRGDGLSDLRADIADLRAAIDEPVRPSRSHSAHRHAGSAPPSDRRLPALEPKEASVSETQPQTAAPEPGRRRLVPVAEARTRLGDISEPYFYRLVRRGELSTVKLGRRTFVVSDEIERFIAGLPAGRGL